LNFIESLLDYLEGAKVIVIFLHSAAFDIYKPPGSVGMLHLQ
jgi:hypothetical protein